MLNARTLTVAAVAMGLLEAFMLFVIEVPAAALVFAVLFLAGAAWFARRGAVAAAAALALLFAVELLGVPFYERSGVADWLVQLTAAALSAVGLAAAVAVIARGRTPQAA
jgi:hypothetical protein